MKKILASSALTLSVFFLLASASAKAQQLNLFESAYARPVETVDGLDVGARFDFGPSLGTYGGGTTAPDRSRSL
jgi:hypothetical protein